MLKKFISSLFVKSVGVLSGFFLFVFLGREFGASITGVFSISLAIVFIGSAVSRFGIDMIVLREASPLFSENKLNLGDQSLLSKLVSNTLIYVMAGSVIVSFVVLVFINFYSNMDDVEASYYSIASCSIIFVSIFNVSFQLLQAQKKMAGAMFVLTLLPQLLLLLFASLLTKDNLYYSIIIAMFTTCCVSLYMVRNCITVLSIPAFYEIRKLIILASPLLVGVLAQVMMNWSPSLLSGFYLEPSDVGILSVCVKAAALLGFIFIAINGYASSRFSASFKAKNLIDIKNTFKNSVLLMWTFGLPLFIALYYFSYDILIVFGEDFSVGVEILRVILIGQLVAVVTGPATSLLVMIGEVGKYKVVMLISLASQLLLIPFGAYIGGLIYAAIAVSLCYGFQNIAAYWLAMRCLNNMKY